MATADKILHPRALARKAALNIPALQDQLRHFAAERDWEPFHTPKNLAMALMVEAAELAEIFQWLTAEESVHARDDAALRERIGDELADVLVYAAQMADRTGIDLDDAVVRKLRKNALKHPPLHPGQSVAPQPAPAARTYVLIDWENVQPKEADVRALVPGATDIWLFHGATQKNVDMHHTSFGDRATTVKVGRPGKNALDFLLSFYLGYIAARNSGSGFVVLSNDQGYGPMIEHAEELGFAARQVHFGSRGRAPAKKAARLPAARKVAAKKIAAPAVATKKAAVRQAVAKPVAAKPVAAKTVAVKPVATKPMAARPSASKPPASKPVAAKRVAAKPVPAKKAAADKRVPAKKAAADKPMPAKTAAVAFDVARAAERIVAGLGKRGVANRPSKQARLLADIAQKLTLPAGAPEARAVFAKLLASGKVTVDAKGAVRYAL
jgi:NTP pyrophosphatase (non-canonical NTP hydrolase)